MSNDTFDTFGGKEKTPETILKTQENPNQIKFAGKLPPAMKQALRMVRGDSPIETAPVSQARAQGSSHLEDLISGLVDKSFVYEEVVLPSKGAFYDGQDGPKDGILHIRPMTGEEEQILATPRYVRRGLAINMIFQRCLKENNFSPDNFLSADRTFLLIWLRGISYTPKYEVEVKCPECGRKYNTELNLAELIINDCPKNFKPPLNGKMPTSGYKFNYRLSRGSDETAIQEYRDKRLKDWGDTGVDDSLIYRTAMMLDDIEGLTDKKELMMLLKKLPIQDVSYLRNRTTEPPFGVNTKCNIDCPGCQANYEVDLPLEANFFFPRPRQTAETPA